MLVENPTKRQQQVMEKDPLPLEEPSILADVKDEPAAETKAVSGGDAADAAAKQGRGCHWRLLNDDDTASFKDMRWCIKALQFGSSQVHRCFHLELKRDRTPIPEGISWESD